MKISELNAKTRVLPSALPRTYDGGEPAVLLIHGFTGFPVDMHYLAEELHGAGFTVRVPRLPGHGTDGADFLSTNRRDWLRRVTDEYLELAALHEQVYVAGLSMGGLLSVLLAATFPLERTALLAPALAVRNRYIPLSGLVGLFKKRMPDGAHELYEDPDMEFVSREYWDYIWPGQTWELYQLQKLARRALPKLSGRILTVVSEADETVPPKVAGMVETGAAGAEVVTVVLRESGHVVTRESERERVAAEVIRFFS